MSRQVKGMPTTFYFWCCCMETLVTLIVLGKRTEVWVGYSVHFQLDNWHWLGSVKWLQQLCRAASSWRANLLFKIN